MPWNFDIRDRMRPAHPGGQIPPGLERYYWELNLMIHLLDGYIYDKMSADTVADAMDRFADRVNVIPNDVLDSPAVKGQLRGTLNSLAAVFRGSHPEFTMKNLYLTSIPPLNHNLAVQHFDTLQQQMAGAKNFPGGGPRICMPFLEWQRNGAGFPPEATMNAFLSVWGIHSLRTLIETPRWPLSDAQKQALDDAKSSGILITRPPMGGPVEKTVQFDNQLECQGGTCQPIEHGFCLSASDGTCSATSG